MPSVLIGQFVRDCVIRVNIGSLVGKDGMVVGFGAYQVLQTNDLGIATSVARRTGLMVLENIVQECPGVVVSSIERWRTMARCNG